jgi:hypothetical protein
MSLWAMLPEGQQVPPPGVAGKPAILAHRLHLDGGRVDPSTYAGGPIVATTRLVLREIPEASRGARWEDYVAWFPGLQNPRPPDHYALGRQGVLEASWRTNWDDFEESTYEWKSGLDDTFVHPHIPVTSYRGIECAIPLLPGMSDPLHPLTIWWSVLFALSMLARYELVLAASNDSAGQDQAEAVRRLQINAHLTPASQPESAVPEPCSSRLAPLLPLVRLRVAHCAVDPEMAFQRFIDDGS